MSKANDPLRQPLKIARGLGSAKSGTHHFVVQRISAVALIFLSLYVLGLVLFALGGDYASAHAAVAHPFNSIVLIAFVLMMFWHSQLGLQVIIEDYVHTPGWATVLQLLNRFVNAFAAIAAVLAIVRITLGNTI